MLAKDYGFLQKEISSTISSLNTKKSLNFREYLYLYIAAILDENIKLKDLFSHILENRKFNRIKLIYNFFMGGGLMLVSFYQLLYNLKDTLNDYNESFLSMNIDIEKLKIYYFWGLIYRLFYDYYSSRGIKIDENTKEEIKKFGNKILKQNKLNKKFIISLHHLVVEKHREKNEA